MKNIVFLTFIMLLATNSGMNCYSSPDRENVKSKIKRVQFHETDSIFSNPGQGMMSSRFPHSIRYIRMDWVDLEPERGKYNWSRIDSTIAAEKLKGAKVAIRIMTCNKHSRGYYSSPKWLFDEGCRSYEYMITPSVPRIPGVKVNDHSGGALIMRIQPEYSDPIYLKRHSEFLMAMARKYNDSNDIEFMDIGSYGYWGEWHTDHPAPVEVRKQIVNMYVNAFTKIPLVFMTDDAEVLPYALEKGSGMRRDGVGSASHEKNWIGTGKYAGIKEMGEVWLHEPIVFEGYGGGYEYHQQKGWSFESAINFMLKNHITINNDNMPGVPAEKMYLIEKIARLAGARFVLKEITHEASIKKGSAFNIDMTWANTGAGKVYKPYVLRLFLLDTNGRVVLTSDAGADPCSWLPGDPFHVRESIQIPRSLKKGTYKLALAIENKDKGERSFRLAIDLPETNGRYVVSEVMIK